ncbi:MAG: metallophosphoesterase, partial [Ruminiclostridium sp.]|nr:metallophosphoesterase [Ruminiclostridium sp.]
MKQFVSMLMTLILALNMFPSAALAVETDVQTDQPEVVSVKNTEETGVIDEDTRWSYLDDGTDPAGDPTAEGYDRTSWTTAAFDDSNWETGKGPFGACKGTKINSNNYNEEATTLLEGCTSSNDHPAYFFRTKIYVAEEDLDNGLTGTITYDDSAIVYINGENVFEGNLGQVKGNSDFSGANQGVASINDFTVSSKNLQAGWNTVAVEVHNSNASSWDIWFDMRLSAPRTVEATPEITEDTVWSYLDNGTDPGQTWAATGFNDDAWSTGIAPFGAYKGYKYNPNNSPAEMAETLLDGCTGSNDHPAYFFRTKILVEDLDAITCLKGTLRYDDSAIVYVNGSKVYEGNIGKVTGNTSFSNANNGEANEDTIVIPASALVKGENTVAVQVHQSNIGSLDIWFDMTLAPVAGDKASLNDTTVWTYLDNNTDPAGGNSTNRLVWTAENYDDSAWKQGFAPFGSYEGSPVNKCNSPVETAATLLNGCLGSNNYPAYFFRTELEIDALDEIACLKGNISYDDAVIVYINGTKVFEGNNIRTTDDAGGTAIAGSEITGNLQYAGLNQVPARTAELLIDPAVLKEGNNIVAVELHQRGASGSDIWFNIDLAPSDEKIEYQSDINMTMGADQTQMNFTWYHASSQAGRVLLAKESDLVDGQMPTGAKAFAAKAAQAADGSYSNQATVTGLEPGVTYAYQLVNERDTSNIYTFTTDDGGEFSFAYVSDPQIGMSGVASNTASWDKTLNEVIEHFTGVDFLLTAGDQVNNAANEEHYNGLLDHDVLKSLPLAPVIGNHDNDGGAGTIGKGGGQFDQHYNLANESTQYGVTQAGGDSYFVYNNVLFMVLNTSDKSTAEHEAFMQAAIEANPNVTWKVVALHHSLYSGHASSDGATTSIDRAAYDAILQKMDVDVVLQGHDHIYCRSYILDSVNHKEEADYVYGNGEDKAPTAVNNPKGILYMTANAGSNSGHFTLNNPNFTYAAVQNQENVPNVSEITISDTQFTITTYRTTDMTVVDTFTINKTDSSDENDPVENTPVSTIGASEINADTQWKYLDNGADPAGNATAEGYDRISWTKADYNDSAWERASGKFGSKSGSLNALAGGYTPTVLLSQYKDGTTTDKEAFFFRTQVTIQDASDVKAITGSLIYDDAAVVYINGTKVAGFNDDLLTETGGNLQYSGDGDTSHVGHTDAPATGTINITDPAVLGLLNDGVNTIAVELHQDRASSSDIYLEFSSLEFNTQVNVPVTATEVNEDTVWSYLDDGTDPAAESTDRTSWAAENFDDSDWKTSKSSLGAKRGALGEVDGYTPEYLLNQYKADGSNVEAFFFRTKVNVADASAVKQILGSVVYDDSATVYINGVKVAGFDDSEITANLQYGGHNGNTAEGKISITDAALIRSALKDGVNVVAVEVHQGRAASSDIYFDMPSLVFSTEEPVEVLEQSNLSLSMGANQSQMNFTWHCTTQDAGTLLIAENSAVNNGQMPANAASFEATSAANNDGKYTNKAVATGLKAGTTYAYQVVNGELKSEIRTFTTDDGEAFSFAYVGDPQIGASGNATNDTTGWNNTLKVIGSNDIFSGISFLLSAGDQVDTASSESQYDGYLDHSVLNGLPVATVIGNHDSGSDAYSEHFNVPNEDAIYGTSTTAGSDYWFVYNNVLFMVLNTNDLSAAEHKDFMQAAIKANPNVDWKVVSFHQSIYTVASHYNNDKTDRRETLAPIFKELDIDVVLQGHDHVYCRTYMMDGLEVSKNENYTYGNGDNNAPTAVTNPNGILYITANSGSGSKHYGIKTDMQFPYSAVQNQEKVPNVSKVEISENQFTITTYRTNDMTVVDTFTINRTEEVPQKTLEGISVTTQPTKTSYKAGETFDPAGMLVTATYSDDTTEAVTGYTVAPNGPLTTKDK